MKIIADFLKKNYKEIAYQVAINFIIFLIFSYNQSKDENISYGELFSIIKISFFGNYLIAALIINYLILPNFYYKKKNLLFCLSFTATITLVILIDENVLEQIYYPTTRGTYFPGITFTLIETLPIIILLVSFKFIWDLNKKQREVENLKTLIKESELQFLKSQINPHFLFNNLNNLYAYSLEDSTKTSSIILELSSVLRYMLYDCKENYVSLAKEIKHLQSFSALNELQIEDRGTINFTTNSSDTKYYIAPLILNVFIENAFKHSTASQTNNIKIFINISITKSGVLNFTCKNSFTNYNNTFGIAKGIGLANVKKRLQLLYPNSHQLNINKNNNTYTVNLCMQLKPIN